MWIQVRSMDGTKLVRIDGLSKLTKVEELREILEEHFDAAPDRQRLFFSGKQLVDGHTLFDYNVVLNAIVQIMIRPAAETKQSPKKEPSKEITTDLETTKEGSSHDVSSDLDEVHGTFKIGDIIDARDDTMGAWFEAKIMKITLKSREPSDKEIEQLQHCQENAVSDSESRMEIEMKEESLLENKQANYHLYWGNEVEEDEFVYHVWFEGYEDDEIVKVMVKNIRPRARHKIPFEDVKIGDQVMINYNYDEPDSRGYWYDAVITAKRDTRTIKELEGTVFIGKDLVPMVNCNLLFRDELFSVEKNGSQLNAADPNAENMSPVKRTNKPECDHCGDIPRKKCKHCSCSVCGDKKDPDKQILCDECDQPYHLYCLDPPLDALPDDDEWYCPQCKNDSAEVVQAGQKLKDSKKKSKMASASSKTKRDWGKGMACQGRTKQCNTVPPNHFGPIPGVEVGSLWLYRVQVSEAGVHRPHVAGIHGREDEGSYSIVLAGGYEDDHDDGDEFTYTGSGGRDLSGNKRTAEQSMDQTLTRFNRALAKNCDASIDNKGAEAKDWKKGKPIRVVRNCKGRAHSKYAPEVGNRYDGIYKMVKYWPDKGKSGFIVWRYLLRRDDSTPAPWTKEGKKRIAQLGLEMQYPEGYQEKMKEKEEKENEKREQTPKAKRGRKRKNQEDEEEVLTPLKESSQIKKKQKVTAYELDENLEILVKKDHGNQKLWKEALELKSDGAKAFLGKVEILFLCVCCQELVYRPISTKCSHNICKPCLQMSFKAEVYSCPSCRDELGKDYSMEVNNTLFKVLQGLFPGYDAAR